MTKEDTTRPTTGFAHPPVVETPKELKKLSEAEMNEAIAEVMRENKQLFAGLAKR